MLKGYAQQVVQNLRARVMRYYRGREVVNVLHEAHVMELARTPGEQWPLMKQQHLEEVQAVRDGKFDIVDRRSWAYPYLPEALHRLNQPILKNTPYNLRRFSETPIPRRAINLIKNGLLSLEWRVEPTKDFEEETEERTKRIAIAEACLSRPNNNDSFRTLMEAVLEDIIIGAYGVLEPEMTPSPRRPFKLWSVDGSTIRIYADYTEGTPERPRYAQMTGLKGERGIVAFRSDELFYIRDNVRTSTPFGLGKLEVAFNSVNAFLGVQDMSSRAGSNQARRTWLWWEQTQNPGHVQTIRRHLQNEAEGQAKVSLMAGMNKPEVIDVTAVQIGDLLLEWQEFLIRIIANAFDLSPFALGLERDVNRNTGEVMAQTDFKAAVVPMARRIEEALTRDLLHGYMGWKDLQFRWVGLEDPDAETKAGLQQRKYAMNAITPDEVREEEGKPPLPGGWGRLTQGQLLILAQQAAAESQIIVQRKFMDMQKEAQEDAGPPQLGPGGVPPGVPGMPGQGGLPTRPGGGGAPPIPKLPGGTPGGGMGLTQPPMPSMTPIRGSNVFSADDIMRMSPEDIVKNQNEGHLPSKTTEIEDGMEEQHPGLLETLSDELRDFFENQEKLEEESQVQPEEITNRDRDRQLKRFKESRERITVDEQMALDRGMWNPPGQANPVVDRGGKNRKVRRKRGNRKTANDVDEDKQPGARGKYPRSGGKKR